jgi:hypothetical protein
MADDEVGIADHAGTERARLVTLREGGRTSATRMTQRLVTIFAMEEMSPEKKVHELESKITELTVRSSTLEDYDQQIFALTIPGDIQCEVEDADIQNTPYRNHIDLHRYPLYTLRHLHDL